MSLSKATYEEVDAFQQKLSEAMRKANYLEEAAQWAVNSFYDEFYNSIVLARVFVTVPFEQLPPANQQIVSNTVRAKGVENLLRPQTLVLSMIGSRGIEPTWNDRRHSQGHIAIPLISNKFIEEIPMMARMLKEMGVPLMGVDSDDTGFDASSRTKITGLFYVADAASAQNQHGQKIISAQDFVQKYRVKTVFGSGATILVSRQAVCLIIFSREFIPRPVAAYYIALANTIAGGTTEIVAQGRIFKDQPDLARRVEH